ncbi:ABC transporter ATP-binding protein [Wolbachia endosymbiont of Folsomia candida]|uniref:ABC transporter ATP-binding protein n=1 Tax=Wolbachia endosymbiont of Folsomia candida TaxID=169402 RepID=UPI000A8C1828|nr:ABC transporter ATP-binding protein [Wolbachia endosymbiont of Folsomia candida]APR99081.1 ABC transporter ATP-binding protein [Wolbachia endosymbiont of Folsomia candida]
MLINNVSYFYNNQDDFTLSNINIKVKKGNIACLLGHSGCGKSTILKLIAGIENPKSGTILINDRLVASNKTLTAIEDRNVGLVFQHSALFPHKTVLENIAFAIKNSSKIGKRHIALGILKLFDIEKYENMYPNVLSGGQQQLVAIARAMAQNPDVMLLDEPFSNLDMLLKRRVRQHILSLFKRKNIPVLMVTHDPQEALEVADFIYVMKNGKIIQSGVSSDIYHQPKDDTLAKFFSELSSTLQLREFHLSDTLAARK